MADIQWIKLWLDIFSNRKIVRLRQERCGDSMVLRWIWLLTLAGKCNDGGRIYVTKNLPYTEKSLAKELDCTIPKLRETLEKFRELDMICDRDGYLTVKNWCIYQNIEGMDKIRAQTRERVRKFRDGKAKDLEECNVTVTLRNATDKEKEKEKEKERRKRGYISHNYERYDPPEEGEAERMAKILERIKSQ